MKTSEAEKHDWRCPKCNGRTTQDRKGRGFVRHIERNKPNDSSVSKNKKGQCRYGRHERD